MRAILFIVLGFTYTHSYAQKSKNDSMIYRYLEKMPAFRSDIKQYITRHLHYPVADKTGNAEGIVDIQFLVQSTGKLADIKVVKSIHPLLDSEAIKMIRDMPDWAPGQVNGRNVNAYYTLPITFQLSP